MKDKHTHRHKTAQGNINNLMRSKPAPEYSDAEIEAVLVSLLDTGWVEQVGKDSYRASTKLILLGPLFDRVQSFLEAHSETTHEDIQAAFPNVAPETLKDILSINSILPVLN